MHRIINEFSGLLQQKYLSENSEILSATYIQRDFFKGIKIQQQKKMLAVIKYDLGPIL